MSVYFDNGIVTLHHGDARAVLAGLPAETVHCCVCSPPYYGLRDYGVEGQLGLEETPEEFVTALVAVFREGWRVLRDDGTLWLNLGDSYAGGSGGRGDGGRQFGGGGPASQKHSGERISRGLTGQKPKDLLGIPWAVAFALRADGWYLRSEIIWNKPAPMPESVTDRPTKSHEQLFLLAKSDRYFYDAQAIREPAQDRLLSSWDQRRQNGEPLRRGDPSQSGHVTRTHPLASAAGRNRRSVWTINTEVYPDAHFATFPTDLVKPCILAGTSAEGVCEACGAPWRRLVEKESRPNQSDNRGKHNGAIDRTVSGGVWNDRRKSHDLGWQPSCTCAAPVVPATVLDPFSGSGTTGAVAQALGRRAVLIELKEDYCALARKRIASVTPALNLAL